MHSGHLGVTTPKAVPHVGLGVKYEKNHLSPRHNIPDYKALNTKFTFTPQLGAPVCSVSTERHLARRNTQGNPAVNFLNHCKVTKHVTARCSEGGLFETQTWSKPQARLGTAVAGHQRNYLVSEVVRQAHSPHNNRDFAQSQRDNSKEYHIRKTFFSAFTNSNPETKPMLRPNFETMRACNARLVQSRT